MVLMDNSAEDAPCIIVGDVSNNELLVAAERHADIFLITTKSAEIDKLTKVRVFDAKNAGNAHLLINELKEWLLAYPTITPGVKILDNVSENIVIYEQILQSIIIFIDERQRIHNSRKLQGYWVQKRIFKNLPWILSNALKVPDSGLFEKNLAVVIGAGPSLDKVLPLIAKWSFKPALIVTDTALSATQAIGIEADFVVAIDPQKTCESCEITKKSGIGIFTSDIDESFLELWGENALCICKGEATEHWLQDNEFGLTIFKRCSHAGLTGILLADILGFNNIMLVGMDLACNDSRYANIVKRKINLQNDNLIKINGNYEKFVATPFPGDWHDTCEDCSDISINKTIVNLNDRGAIIDKTILIHPDEASELEQSYSASLENFIHNNSLITTLKNKQNTTNIVKKLQSISKNELKFFQQIKSIEPEEQIKQIHQWILNKELNKNNALKLFGSHVYNILDLIVNNNNQSTQINVNTWTNEMYSLVLTLSEYNLI